MTPLSDIQAFQKAIAARPFSDFEAMNLKELKEFIKPYRTEDFKIVSNLSKSKLPDLLEIIKANRDEYRRLNPAQKFIKNTNEKAVREKAIKAISGIVINTPGLIENDGYLKAIENVRKGLQKVVLQGIIYPYTDDHGKISQLGSVIASDVITEHETKLELNEALQIFKSTWDGLLYSHRTAAKKITATLVDNRRDAQRIMPDIYGLYAWSRTVLENPQDFEWPQVSIALALATGRRMGEIHSTARFEPVEGNDYVAMFSGQLKSKAETPEEKLASLNEQKEIPLLASFDLVAAGIQYLHDQGKRVYFTPWNEKSATAVNNLYAMALSRAITDLRKSVLYVANQKKSGFEDLKNPNPLALLNYDLFLQFPDLKPSPGLEKSATNAQKILIREKSTTYHNARTIYANTCEILFNKRKGKEGKQVAAAYLSTILGHDMGERSKKDTSKNYEFFDKDEFVGLTFEDFNQKVESINGIEWLKNQVYSVNQDFESHHSS
jgi:hypothetical protein